MIPRGTVRSIRTVFPAKEFLAKVFLAKALLAPSLCALLAAALSSTGVACAAAGGGSHVAERFHHQASSTNFEVACEHRIPLDSILSVAETTLARTRAWLGLTGPPPGPTRIYVADDATGLLLVQREHDLDAARWRSDERQFRGRCFAEARVIVVPFDTPSLDWQVSHEVTHLVFHEIVGRNVEIVNEGLAELVPWWILCGTRDTPEVVDSQYDLYDRRLAQAVLARELPTFDAFLSVEESTFYDERANWLWYALSWKLAKVLVESPDPAIRGRFRPFLDALATGVPVWPALRSVYDARAIEAAWNFAIERAGTWRPLFGDWRSEGNELIGSVSGAHSACVVSHATMFPGEPLALELTLSGPPPPAAAFGFAFDVRGEDEFAYVEFRPASGHVAIAEYGGGRWTRVECHALAPLANAALISAGRGSRIALRASGRGRLDLFVEGLPVFRFELGRPLRGGSAGAMFENLRVGAGESDTIEMRFSAVSLTR